MALFALVAGMGISPMLITLYSMLSNLVPKSSITEGFAWFASVITFGISAGIAVAGYLVDYAESFGALLFLAGAGCAVPPFVLLTRRLLSRTPFAEPEPAAAAQLADTGAAA
jgi:MFS family permease